MLIAANRILKRESAVAEAAPVPTENVDEAIARVLSRRLEAMLDPDLVPEALFEMAEQVEVISGDPAPTDEDVEAAWQEAVAMARIRLGDLTNYRDASLVAHAAQISRAMYGLARAAWRNDDAPDSLLLGQAYECAASVIEQTVIGEWPSNERELKSVLEYDTRRMSPPREDAPASPKAEIHPESDAAGRTE